MRHRKILVIGGILLVAMLLFSSSLWAQAGVRLSQGAKRLCNLQSDILGDLAQNGYTDTDPEDGGWDWDITPATTEHSASASPENTYGVTAFGLAAAMAGGGFGQRYLMCAMDAYNGMTPRPEVDSAMDFAYCCFMDWLYNPGFRHLGKERYDAKIATYGSATALAEFIRDSRHGQGYDGLIPYDLGLFVFAAFTLEWFFPGQGYQADAAAFSQVIADDINAATPFFDIDDNMEQFYYTGLAWTIFAMKFGQADLTLIPIVRQKLLHSQEPSTS